MEYSREGNRKPRSDIKVFVKMKAVYFRGPKISCNTFNNLEEKLWADIPQELRLSWMTSRLDSGFVVSAKPKDKRQLGSKCSLQKSAIHLLDFKD